MVSCCFLFLLPQWKNAQLLGNILSLSVHVGKSYDFFIAYSNSHLGQLKAMHKFVIVAPSNFFPFTVAVAIFVWPTWSQTMHFILNWQSFARLCFWCYFRCALTHWCWCWCLCLCLCTHSYPHSVFFPATICTNQSHKTISKCDYSSMFAIIHVFMHLLHEGRRNAEDKFEKALAVFAYFLYPGISYEGIFVTVLWFSSFIGLYLLLNK